MASGTTQKTALAAFFGMSNFALLSSDPYFSPRPGFNPFTQTWSLAVEEQFYLFYPLILFVAFRLGRRRGLLSVAANALLPLLLVASFLALWWISGINRDAAFYMLPYRFWELAAGAVLFMLQRRGVLRLVTLGRLAGWAGAVLVLATAWYADWRASPFPWSVPAVVGSVLVIAALTTEHVPSTLISKLLGSRPVVFVGKLSVLALSLALGGLRVISLDHRTRRDISYGRCGGADACPGLRIVRRSGTTLPSRPMG